MNGHEFHIFKPRNEVIYAKMIIEVKDAAPVL